MARDILFCTSLQTPELLEFLAPQQRESMNFFRQHLRGSNSFFINSLFFYFHHCFLLRQIHLFKTRSSIRGKEYWKTKLVYRAVSFPAKQSIPSLVISSSINTLRYISDVYQTTLDKIHSNQPIPRRIVKNCKVKQMIYVRRYEWERKS